jgi:hypothetical protein
VKIFSFAKLFQVNEECRPLTGIAEAHVGGRGGSPVEWVDLGEVIDHHGEVVESDGDALALFPPHVEDTILIGGGLGARVDRAERGGREVVVRVIGHLVSRLHPCDRLSLSRSLLFQSAYLILVCLMLARETPDGLQEALHYQRGVTMMKISRLVVWR